MVPWDQQVLMKTPVTPAQYTVWKQEYQDLCVQKGIENLNNNIAITAEMLAGEGVYNTPKLQACYADRRAYTQAAKIVCKAWRKVPDMQNPTKSFSTVRQGASEPFVSFIDRLGKAIECQIDNTEAGAALLKQLVYENANQDCKHILKPHYTNADTTLADMLKLCQNVGTEMHKASVLAAVIQGRKNLKGV